MYSIMLDAGWELCPGRVPVVSVTTVCDLSRGNSSLWGVGHRYRDGMSRGNSSLWGVGHRYRDGMSRGNSSLWGVAHRYRDGM